MQIGSFTVQTVDDCLDVLESAFQVRRVDGPSGLPPARTFSAFYPAFCFGILILEGAR
jgi:hypothetical protein